MFVIIDIWSIFEGRLLQTCVSKMYKATLRAMLQNELSICLSENTHYDTKRMQTLKLVKPVMLQKILC